MEHRLQVRRPVSLEVRLAKRGRKVGSTIARDISGGGMCIETSDLELRRGEMLDVDLPRRVPPVPDRHMRAVVVRREGGLAGLMFV